MSRLGRITAGFLGLSAAAGLGLVPSADAGDTFGPDPGFGKNGLVVVTPPGRAREYGNALAALPDGSVVVVGSAVPDPDRIPALPIEPEMPSLAAVPVRTPSFPTTPQELGPVILLLRFLPDGRLDPGFGKGGRVWTDLFQQSLPAGKDAVSDQTPPGAAAGYTVLIQPDGKILVGGTTASELSLGFALLRYLPDGTLDRTFGQGGIVVTDVDLREDDGIGTLALEPHGRIVAAGRSGIRGALARYHPDGTLDAGFGDGGTVVTPGYREGMAVVLDPEHRIVVGGQAGDSLDGPYDFAIARYRPDGHLDLGFGKGGVTVTDLGQTGEFATGLKLEADGRLLLTGVAGGSAGLARYRPDGTLDPTFGQVGKVVSADGASGRISVFLPDGRTLLGGGIFGTTDRDVALSRFLPDGSFDAGFGNKGVVATDVGGSRDDEGFSAANVANRLVVTGTSYKDQTEPLVFLLRYAY